MVFCNACEQGYRYSSVWRTEKTFIFVANWILRDCLNIKIIGAKYFDSANVTYIVSVHKEERKQNTKEKHETEEKLPSDAGL